MTNWKIGATLLPGTQVLNLIDKSPVSYGRFLCDMEKIK